MPTTLLQFCPFAAEASRKDPPVAKQSLDQAKIGSAKNNLQEGVGICVHRLEALSIL